MRIYVASSWRNDFQPDVVKALRDAGHEVYDFKSPEWNDKGFHWSEIDGGWQSWDFPQYLQALGHPLAEAGYKSDYDAMEWADACILVLPCGRSAHLELGWSVGKGKKTAILHPMNELPEPELMAKMVDYQTNSLTHMVRWANEV